MSILTERRILQAIVAFAALVPVLTGAAGVVLGPALLRATPPWPIDLDSHLRFLSGLFIVVGLAWMSCVRGIERKTERLRLLALMTFCGGLARLYSFGLAGSPSLGHLYGLGMECVGVPLLAWWQARIAREVGNFRRD